MVQIEIKATNDYLKVLAVIETFPKIDDQLKHMLTTWMYNTFGAAKMIIHEIPIDKAVEYLKEMHSTPVDG